MSVVSAGQHILTSTSILYKLYIVVHIISHYLRGCVCMMERSLWLRMGGTSHNPWLQIECVAPIRQKRRHGLMGNHSKLTERNTDEEQRCNNQRRLYNRQMLQAGAWDSCSVAGGWKLHAKPPSGSIRARMALRMHTCTTSYLVFAHMNIAHWLPPTPLGPTMSTVGSRALISLSSDAFGLE